jgi:isoquinoline 1-oxidoreductase beta subunit
MKRRAFLTAAGAGLSVSFVAGCSLPVIPKRPAPQAEDALSWIRFADGRYTLFMPRVEMGQNIATGLKQVACEELGIEWSALDLRLHGTADIRRVRATVGSESIKDYALPLAQACATLRDALAAGRTTGQIEVQPRPVAELRAFAANARFVGHAMPIEQGAALLRGEPLFAIDVRRPGMLYGRVLRAPVSPELHSLLRAADEASARAVPGLVAVVHDRDLMQGNSQGLGIVARTPGALNRIEAALAAQWAVDGGFDQADIDATIDIDARLQRRGTLGRQIHGDAIDAASPWDVDLRFDIPLAAHAAIQPRAAVAEFGADGRLQLWLGSQDVFYMRDVVARRLGLDEAQVVMHGQRVGGAFGGRTICSVELEAALLARAVKAPVKVQWTRAQEFQYGFHRPPSSHRIRVRLKDGKLHSWWHAIASSHILFTNAAMPAWMQRLADIVGDDGVARGAALPYRASTRRTELDVVRLPVFTGPWRGLGAGPNIFAIESAIDECARRAGIDPLQFRLDHIDDPRLARALCRVADAARWSETREPTPPGLKRGRGIACGIYKAASYAAVVADVEVEVAGGSVKVLRMWCAHDCGRVVNPDQVRAQCEGNLVWGFGMVLVERLPVAASAVAASSFADSPIPRFGDVPQLSVLIVDEGETPSGAGETAIVAAGAAVANAIRDATGVRATRLPVTPSQLQAAMA